MESPSANPQIGIHYFPDSEHYRIQDAAAFFPVIKSMGSSFLFLSTVSTTAIPEYFLSQCLTENLHPVIHLKIPVETAIQNKDLYLLVETYAKWGVKYLIFFDRPNMRQSWSAPVWVLPNLVERYVDHIYPFFEIAHRLGILPILSPLEPGGDYWDTLFLRSTLQAFIRRNPEIQFGYSAYAWTCGNPIEWGAGGPERWPLAQPYHHHPEHQDHRGVRIFEWYSSIAKSIGYDKLPLYLLETGKPKNQTDEPWQGIEILNSLFPETNEENGQNSLSNVKTVGLWMPGLPDSPEFSLAVDKIREWYQEKPQPKTESVHQLVINHYVLIGTGYPALIDWRMRASHSFIIKHKATVGFSIEEAAKAKHVTILAREDEIPEEDLNYLRHNGISVERIDETGTALATILGER